MKSRQHHLTFHVILSSTADEDDTCQQAKQSGTACSLSGLTSLYTGIDASTSNIHTSAMVDAETIWGQVDLQNNALLPKLKKLIKKLTKISENETSASGEDDNHIRLLDMAMDSENEEKMNDGRDEDSEDKERFDEGSAASNLDENEPINYDDDNSEEEVDEARRIRERMEKAMAEMDGSSDEQNNSADDNSEAIKKDELKALSAKAKELEDSIIDPTRENMRDGFFDLHEMEAFADEEEEYLPDMAYGNEIPVEDQEGYGSGDSDDDMERGKKKQKKAVLPHVRDRMGGDSDSDGGESDDESKDGLTKRFKTTTARRKKYRADDEIDALYELYGERENDEFSDNSDDDLAIGGGVDATDLTAAEFFGKPDESVIKRYNLQHKDDGKNAKKSGSGGKAADFDDADSWDEHDFADDAADWKGSMSEEEEEEAEDDVMQYDSEGGAEESSEEEDAPEQHKRPSTHSLQSQKLEAQTLLIEQEMMAEKPWRMLGESKGKHC